MNIILTCIGKFQEYILENIRQLILLGHKQIYVITEPAFFNYFADLSVVLMSTADFTDTFNYVERCEMDTQFRNGFWAHTSARFFYIYECMQKYQFRDVIHLENDVLIYYNVDVLLPLLNKTQIYMPFDSYTRNIASIVYIPNHEALGFILEYYDVSKNDMENFAKHIADGSVANFPIFTDNENFVSRHFGHFPYIFDAAAMGQYLGGVDPENIAGDTRGFINETCVVKYDKYPFIWSNHQTNNQLYQPFLLVNGEVIPVFNLHIHSKTLSHFSSISRAPFYNPWFSYVSNPHHNTSPPVAQYINDVELYATPREQMQWFDIVIPVGPNDISFIHTQTKYIRENVLGYRNVYLVSYDDTLCVAGCITISETLFPFSKANITNVPEWRRGWYLQQLLKLYAGSVIPNIMDTILVVDSDTVFMRPIHFIENMNCVYGYSSEYHAPYFVHSQKLHPSFTRQTTKSGIVHYMLFQQKYIKKIFSMVETLHHRPFWQAFIDCVDPAEESGASEYELYFHYMSNAHPDKIQCRELHSAIAYSYSDIPNKTADVVSCHAYLRR